MSDQESDRAAIIDLIHRTRIAIWTHDMDTWASCFVHADYTARSGYWKQGGTFFRRGWDDIWRRSQSGHPPKNPNYAFNTKVENLSLQIGTDMAWATFDQIYPGTIDDHVGSGLVHEMRVFERHSGAWKIAYLGFLDANAAAAGSVMLKLDPEGRVLWQSPAAPEAFADNDDIVIRNDRLRFRDNRLDRKLRDALVWAAKVDNASLLSAHGSVPILVEAGEGLATRIYWLIADSGAIVFSFGDMPVSADRMRLAATIYELSPAQQRLAALVAEGKSLTGIATEMGITPNTARTHLDRVFEKTGVRTQTALVRVLLSVVSPI